MFAVIKTGGKQYRVTPNQLLLIEKSEGVAGDPIEFSDVLMLSDGDDIKVGAPIVSGARVQGTIVEQTRGDKIIVFKKKRRHNYRRKNGHRQYLTVVRITDILASGATASQKTEAASAKKTTEKAASAPKAKAKSKE
ncbi:50S ribosomal protein L21 [Candidatus Bealeia paramacronuclearis]|uniref:Large ribosomal subunit protein bL21 n=1 Tax=Candidatus Bealeia paramacronuclearis TaxID=1921001 RepID=A0ABZ2C502_9PROT|nr:50S ribosomal protein L21 [Candidatus Bealeia paramacronuclearis]